MLGTLWFWIEFDGLNNHTRSFSKSKQKGITCIFSKDTREKKIPGLIHFMHPFACKSFHFIQGFKALAFLFTF